MKSKHKEELKKIGKMPLSEVQNLYTEKCRFEAENKALRQNMKSLEESYERLVSKSNKLSNDFLILEAENERLKKLCSEIEQNAKQLEQIREILGLRVSDFVFKPLPLEREPIKMTFDHLD